MLYLPYDFDELKKKSVPELWEELTVAQFNSICSNVRSAFLEVLPTLDTSNLPESVVETQKYIDVLLPTANEKKGPHLHFLHYWSTLSGVSCHEIMYNGCTHDIPLSGSALFFVKQIMTLPVDIKAILLEYLQNNRSITTNPIYTLYSRSAELAAKKQLTVEGFWISLTSKKNPVQRKRTNFPYGKVEPQESILNSLSYAVTPHRSMWWITWLMCPGLDISLDYFVMQDYSHLATMEGRPLSDEETKYLSAYLLASENAQNSALAKVIHAKL